MVLRTLLLLKLSLVLNTLTLCDDGHKDKIHLEELKNLKLGSVPRKSATILPPNLEDGFKTAVTKMTSVSENHQVNFNAQSNFPVLKSDNLNNNENESETQKKMNNYKNNSTISLTPSENLGSAGIVEDKDVPISKSKNDNKSSSKADKISSITPSIPHNENLEQHINNSSAKPISNATPTTNVVKSNSSIVKPTQLNINSTTAAPATTMNPKPMKPKITYSSQDMPSILNVIPYKTPKISTGTGDKLNVEEPEQPVAQPSQELNDRSLTMLNPRHTDYIIPIVGLIFAVPIIMGGFIILYRRVKDYWSTRHYRRMDFLVDGMYND